MINTGNNTNYGRITNTAMKLTEVQGEKLNRTDKFILFLLIVKQGGTQEAHIANNLIATLSGIQIRAIQKAIQKLNKLKVIHTIRESVYTVNPDYLYKKGEGFGIVQLNVLQSDLSIYAKILYVINVVASGKDNSNFVGRDELMTLGAMSKNSYNAAMKELSKAQLITQRTNFYKDNAGNIRRTSNDKFVYSPDKARLTFTRLESAGLKQRVKREPLIASKEVQSERQTTPEADVKILPSYQETYPRTMNIEPMNTNSEEVTAEPIGPGVSHLRNYREYFSKDFNIELLNKYDSEYLEQIVTLFKVIRHTVGEQHWTINHGDFDNLKGFLINVVDFYKEIEDFRDLLEEMVRSGRKGNSLSYWLSEGVLKAYRGYSNALQANLLFSLDGTAYM